jgi:transcriptional regulator with XRE-family HTH domain
MARKLRQYSAVGKRIATLGRQVDIAKALGMSQQTVSKKLRGEVVITVSDLKRLAKKFSKPLCWFVMWEEDCSCVFHSSSRHVSKIA